MRAIWLIALSLSGAAPAASTSKVSKDAPVCAAPGTIPIFLSPMGEPFRAKPGEPYPSASWFAQADRDHDGAVSRDEMVADAMRFFARLDLNHDGRLTPDEVAAYERDVAPETSLFTARPDDFYDRKPQRHEEGAMGRSEDYGGAMGAGRYAWINIPEPVAAADQDIDRVVTREEFATAAVGIFERLDILNRAQLRLADLPRTPQQIAIEGPCRAPKMRKGQEGK
jgi:hypothetical protein